MWDVQLLNGHVLLHCACSVSLHDALLRKRGFLYTIDWEECCHSEKILVNPGNCRSCVDCRVALK
jgi:hypothetical protein